MINLSKRLRRSTASVLTAVLACGAVTSVTMTSSDKVTAAESASAPAGPSNGVVVRRLTQKQYEQVITDVFGPGIKIGGRFEPIPRQEGLLQVGAGRSGCSVPGRWRGLNVFSD